jgi:uncharacterized protein YidB (DUF937 family)
VEVSHGPLDDLETKAVTGIFGGTSSPGAAAVLEMISHRRGGLAALLESFHEKGLGETASSWVGTGQNLPISSEQIGQVLASDQVQPLAAKAGLSPNLAVTSLAGLLPALIDKLTPNGEIPPHRGLLETGMILLQPLGKTGTDG